MTGPWRGELDADAAWEGAVEMDGDVLVPAGRTLRVRAGASVRFAPRPSWSCAVFRGAPEGYPIEASSRALCDLVVLGRLVIEGTAEEPVRLDGGAWGGITVLESGSVEVSGARLEGAPEALVQAFDDARVRLRGARLRGGAVGVLAWGLARIDAAGCRFESHGTGVLAREGSLARLDSCEFVECGVGAHGQHWSRISARAGEFRACREAGAAAYDRSELRAREVSFVGCGDGLLAASQARARAVGCRFSGNRSGARAIEAGRAEVVA